VIYQKTQPEKIREKNVRTELLAIGGQLLVKTKIMQRETQLVILISPETDQTIILRIPIKICKGVDQIMKVAVITEIVMKMTEHLNHRMIEALKDLMIGHSKDPKIEALIEALNDLMIGFSKDLTIEDMIGRMIADLTDRIIVSVIETIVLMIEIIREPTVTKADTKTATIVITVSKDMSLTIVNTVEGLKTEDLRIKTIAEVTETSMIAEMIGAITQILTEKRMTRVLLHLHIKSRLKNSPEKGVNCN
jgi:hypothetical protein